MPAAGMRYERIGQGYANRRREDPRLRHLIHEALDGMHTLVNIGAGAGSYEPSDRDVVAVEPSAVMVAQRPPGSAPVVRAIADRLPLADDSVDAAMTILSLHHWHPDQRAGVMEMRRVARHRVIVVTVDPEVSGRMWLMADYLPEVVELDHRIFPSPSTIAGWLGNPAEIRVVPISRDTPDGTLMSFWAHPERVLDPDARNVTSGFARQPARVIERVVASVSRDLDNGNWDRRHGQLRELEEFDAGLRLIVA